MINPIERAERIIRNDPDLAEDLFDLLLWAADQPDLKDDNQFDEIMGNLFKRLQVSRDARAVYAKSRVEQVARDDCSDVPLVESVQSVKSH